jgi:hypothetical protein
MSNRGNPDYFKLAGTHVLPDMASRAHRLFAKERASERRPRVGRDARKGRGVEAVPLALTPERYHEYLPATPEAPAEGASEGKGEAAASASSSAYSEEPPVRTAAESPLAVARWIAAAVLREVRRTLHHRAMAILDRIEARLHPRSPVRGG